MNRQGSDYSPQASVSQELGTSLSPNILTERLLDLLQASDEMIESVFHRSRQDTLDILARNVKKLLRAESSAIFLIPEDSSNELVLVAYHLDKSFQFGEVRLKIQNVPKGGMTGYIAHTGEIVRLHGAKLKNHPNNARTPANHLIAGEGFSTLGIPLKDRKGRVLGLAKVDNKKGPDGIACETAFFDEVDEFIARVLLNKIVLVLEGLRTFDALHTLMEAIHHARTLEDILNDILKTGMKLIGADRGDFAWWDIGKLKLVTAAQYGTGRLEVGEVLPERSVVYEVWRTKKPGLIGDVLSDENYRDKYYEVDPSTHSELAVCLEFEGRAVGVLNAESSSLHWFDKQDLKLLQLLAQYATVAAQVVGEETAFRGIVQRLAEHSPSREEVLTGILNSVGSIYGFDSGIIYIADYATRALRCSAFIGCDNLEIDPKEFTYRFDDTALATKAFRDEDGYFSANPEADSEVSQRGRSAFQIIGPLVGVPLIYRGKPVGVLVSWSRHNNPPNEKHKETLKPFARLAATTIAVSESERQRTKVLQRVESILTQMQTELSLEKKLQSILSGAQEAGFDKVRVFEYKEDNQSFVGLNSIGMEKPENVVGYTIFIDKNPYAKYTTQIWSSDTRARRDDASRFGPDPDAEALEKDPKLPWATVPLVTNGRLYGYIAADNSRAKREITDDSIEYLTLYGALAGQAIANQQTIDVLRASMLRDDFLQRLGHIFMTPASSVQMLVQNLKDGVVNNFDFLHYYRPGIVRMMERVLGLSKKIRDFAALRQDIKLDIKSVNLVPLVEDAIAQVQELAREQDVRFEKAFPSLSVWWELDKTRAISAVEALLENAIKFSSKGKIVFLKIETNEQTAKLTVRDEGTGIPDEDLRFIFDIFYRGRNAYRAQVDGTGLGLSIVSRTMDLHGGQAMVRNHPLGGAEFTLVFPKIQRLEHKHD